MPLTPVPETPLPFPGKESPLPSHGRGRGHRGSKVARTVSPRGGDDKASSDRRGGSRGVASSRKGKGKTADPLTAMDESQFSDTAPRARDTVSCNHSGLLEGIYAGISCSS